MHCGLQGSEEEALRHGSPPQLLRPPWRLILLSDGSVTRHLSLLVGQEVHVDCLSMELVAREEETPLAAQVMGADLIVRKVLLRTPTGQALVYARSWWRASEVEHYLRCVTRGGMRDSSFVPACASLQLINKAVPAFSKMSRDKSQPIWTSLSMQKAELYREIVSVDCHHSTELTRWASRINMS